MAQLVEQRIRNAWVAGSSPASGSEKRLLGQSFFVLGNLLPEVLRHREVELAGR